MAFGLQQRAQLINFDHNDIILKAGEAPKGIFIIVSGLVKVPNPTTVVVK